MSEFSSDAAAPWATTEGSSESWADSPFPALEDQQQASATTDSGAKKTAQADKEAGENKGLDKLAADLGDALDTDKESKSAEAAETAKDAPPAAAPSFSSKLLIDVEGVDLDIQRSDKSSPLYSALTFEDVGKQPDTLPIREQVLINCYAKGFKQPSKIQSAALPILLRNSPELGRPENLIFQSQAGTGKTAAFSLNLLTRCDPSIKLPQAIYTAPTFLLCQQTLKTIDELAQDTGATRLNTFNGTTAPNFTKGKITQQIVVGTLGRLANQAVGAPRNRQFDFKNIKYFVIDEADDLLAKPNSRADIDKIMGKLDKNVQVILLSATFEEGVMEFALKTAPEPRAVITLPIKEVTLDNVKQLYIQCRNDDEKFRALCEIYEAVNVGQTVIFVKERGVAFDLAKRLMAERFTVEVLVGGKDMNKQQQDAVLTRFRRGESKVLITTDILARGIDVPQVSLVVNFNLPVDMDEKQHRLSISFEKYAHRIGRAGRFGKKGTAITMVLPQEEQQIKLIEQHYSHPIELVNVFSDEFAEAAKDAEN
ncbi:uncharacterized protein MONBRDRAFT_14272 [Monosiga brevicollis MX1]|uniref:RNA helicase n=1 Tax=Monosiga brevicollis TaxID=81824 RepID=A9USP7_MONBE|nr:uncharacterized protein MONBRDRAFT_14272 [Monosiga brevicollis MX1]EDQ91816.1 predicted protein [Monosiga brevicollis MX1]|eukprot:XP_001743102.1 hypothetical protein [Monosiga brevicollis MX1]